LLLGFHEGLSKGIDFFFGTLEDMESKPLSRFRPNARKTLKLFD
jgi:hypothetical protein